MNTDLEDVIFKVTNGSVTVIEHDWQTAVYTWNVDNTVCTAERTCFCGAKETENGTVTSETTEPTGKPEKNGSIPISSPIAI